MDLVGVEFRMMPDRDQGGVRDGGRLMVLARGGQEEEGEGEDPQCAGDEHRNGERASGGGRGMRVHDTDEIKT